MWEGWAKVQNNVEKRSPESQSFWTGVNSVEQLIQWVAKKLPVLERASQGLWAHFTLLSLLPTQYQWVLP